MTFIHNENTKPGTTDWQITKPALAGEIEGFASSTSVAPGQSIKFYIRAKQPAYIMAFYRMGWYEGKGARLMYSAPAQNAIEQPDEEIDSRNKVECFWKECFEFIIPEDWVTGIYLCKLTTMPDGFERYIIFAVTSKPDKKSTYLFQIATNTYHAYNLWGGYSLYGSKEAFLTNYPQPLNYRARAVSFNRPFEEGHGAGDFFRWEYQFLRWVEKNGLDVAYCSNIDLHEDSKLLSRTKVFLLPGHDEYWSKEMYNQVENSLISGDLGFGFFNANPMYWHSRFEDSYNGKNRTLVCYKCFRYIDFQEDPMNKIDPSMVTAQFRDSTLNKPEQSIVGQMYEGCFINKEPNQDMVFQDPKHWLFEGTGIKAGDRFQALIGYEYDKVWAEYPKPENLVILNMSPVKLKINATLTQNTFSGITIYTKENGNSVFSAGTSSWSWGLDDYGHTNEGLVSEKMQKLTMNVLKFISKETLGREATALRNDSHDNVLGESANKVQKVKKEGNAIFSELNNENTVKQSKLGNDDNVTNTKAATQLAVSRVSKAKLMPVFLMSGGVLGFIAGFMQFDEGFLGLVLGLVVGFAIGYLIDKRRTA